MVWFQRLFPVVMMLWPALVVLLLPPRFRKHEDRVGLTRLGMITLALIMAHGMIQLSMESALPVGSAWRVAWPVFIAVAGGMALWFGPAVRLIDDPAHRAAASGEDAVQPGATVRTASLVPRDQADPVPRGAWLLGWAVFFLCAAALAWAISEGANAGVLGGLGFWLFSGPLAARMSLMEPEPLDPRGAPELREAYERLRAFKAWTF